MKRLRLLCLSVLTSLLLTLAARAQLVPAGGYRLREVRQLARVPEPPGGLIPYRADTLWGYADTTGRVVVRPAFASQPDFFYDGFVLLGELTGWRVKWLPGTLPLRAYQRASFVLNGRGEVLRVLAHEVAVRQPDGSLRAVPGWRAHGQWAVFPAAYPSVVLGPGGRSFASYQLRRVRPDDDKPVATPERKFYVALLGNGRAAWSVANPLPRKWPLVRPITRRALFTLAGRRLTPFDYLEIGEFGDNRSCYRPVGSQNLGRYGTGGYCGYLDTMGRVVIAPQFQSGSAFRQGRAVVVDSLKRDAIIDPAGRVLLLADSFELSEPDEAGYIRQEQSVPAPADTQRVRFLAPPGRPSLAHLWFSEAGPFQHGRAWVRQGKRVGLIDAAGRWVTRQAYEQLWTPALPGPPHAGLTDELGYAVPPTAHDLGYSLPHLGSRWWREQTGLSYVRPDTAYLLACRAGKYGVVERHTGREVVAARYKRVLTSPLRGTVSLEDHDGSVVVTLGTGRVVRGYYQGIDFLTPQGRLLYVTQSRPVGWALLDTTGRLRTTWIAGTGYPTAPGWLLSQYGQLNQFESPRWLLCDTAGRELLASHEPIEQPASDARWELVRQSLAEAGQDATSWPSWQLALPAPRPEDRAAFRLRDDAHGGRLLDAQLRELGEPPLVATPGRLQWLVGNWAYLLAPYPPQVPRPEPTVLRLYTDEGYWLPAPAAGGTWAYVPGFDYSYAWRYYGVLPTEKGYLTRGGRPLWRP